MCEKCKQDANDTTMYETKRDWLRAEIEKRNQFLGGSVVGIAGSGGGMIGATVRKPVDRYELFALLELAQNRLGSQTQTLEKQVAVSQRLRDAGMVRTDGQLDQEGFYVYLDALLQVPYPVKTWRMP